MAIWAIADIHASATDPTTGRAAKPMDVFGPAWDRHVERLETAWDAMVGPTDTVLIAGDIDWALRMDDARQTLCRIAEWKGNKILIRGNHDYWWSSKNTNRVRRDLPLSLRALHNDALIVEGFNICGAKGSPVPGSSEWSDENTRLLDREVARLERSLEGRDASLETIVMLHYPPFYSRRGESLYRSLLEERAVIACVYGHLHGQAGNAGPQGRINGVEYYLVAGDQIAFCPVLVAENGAIVPYHVSEKGTAVTSHADPRGLDELAEELISPKRDEGSDEDRARELNDLPTEPAAALADEQDES